MGYAPNMKGGDLQTLASTVLAMKQNIDMGKDIYDMGKEGINTVRDIYNDMGFNSSQKKQRTSFESSARNTNVQSAKDKKLRNEYNVPGFSNEIMILEKVKPSIKRKLGQTVTYDPFQTFLKNLKSNGHVTMNYKFKCDSDIDKRGFHFQVFRHRLSPDNSSNNGGVQHVAPLVPGKTWVEMDAALVGGNSYYNILEPTSHGFSTNSYLGVKNTATKVITDGQVCHSSLTLSDLEDMSWNLNNQLLNNAPVKLQVQAGEGSTADFAAITNFSVGEKKYRQSYPGWWNALKYGPDVSGEVSHQYSAASSPQIIPCINNGKLKYTVSNKGIYPGKFEIVVLKTKRNKLLPNQSEFYKHGRQGSNELANLIQEPINQAVHDRVHARYGTTKLNSGATVGTGDNAIKDTFTDPKYKFMPNVSQQKAENTFVKEVERISTIIQAGDTRSIEIVFGGIHKNPNPDGKVVQNVSIGSETFSMPDLYGDDTYILAINYHGLVSSEVVKVGSMAVTPSDPTFHDYINGNCFAPTNFFVEVDYTEHLQNAEVTQAKSSNIFVYGEADPDEYASGVTRLATSILPQSHTVSTAAHHHTVGSTEGGITNPI